MYVLPGPNVFDKMKVSIKLQHKRSLLISVSYSPIGGQFLLYPITVLDTERGQVFPDSLGVLLEDFTQTSLVGRTFHDIYLLVSPLRTRKIIISLSFFLMKLNERMKANTCSIIY